MRARHLSMKPSSILAFPRLLTSPFRLWDFAFLPNGIIWLVTGLSCFSHRTFCSILMAVKHLDYGGPYRWLQAPPNAFDTSICLPNQSSALLLMKQWVVNWDQDIHSQIYHSSLLRLVNSVDVSILGWFPSCMSGWDFSAELLDKRKGSLNWNAQSFQSHSYPCWNQLPSMPQSTSDHTHPRLSQIFVHKHMHLHFRMIRICFLQFKCDSELGVAHTAAHKYGLLPDCVIPGARKRLLESVLQVVVPLLDTVSIFCW